MGKLVLLLADGTTLDVPLDQERLVIGRRADNDVCLPHPAVSGEHAAVVTILADSFLEDLGSTNGTLVNGKAIVKHFLRDNDQIDIGRQRLVFVSNDSVRVDPLPVDVARSQLLGLTSASNPRVPWRRARRWSGTQSAVESATCRSWPIRTWTTKNCRRWHPLPCRKAEKSARPSPFVTIGRRRRAANRTSDWPHGPPSGRRRGARPTPVPWTLPKLRRCRRARSPGCILPPADPSAPAPPEPMVRVLSGPNLGRAVPFRKDELSVGRVGVQVAVVRKVGSGFRLVPVEGAQPPRINGIPVEQEGTTLHPGTRSRWRACDSSCR